jgi:hypothetical protein
MKSGNSFWIIILAFLFGVLTCYISLQFEYFDINTEINVIEMLIAIGTAIIGVFIAITIQKKLNHGQNNYSLIKDKIDNYWVSFNSFSTELKFNTQLELSKMTLFMKDSYSSSSIIESIFDSFNYNKQHLTKIEKSIDALEKTLNTPIKNNFIDLTIVRTEINKDVNKINMCFIDLLKQVSSF